jgi:aldose 1-epimerase
MKLGFCIVAFVVGCLCAVLIRTTDSADKAIEAKAKTLTVSKSEPDLKTDTTPQPMQLKITEEAYGEFDDETSIAKFTCTNVNGLSFEVIEYGATITAITIPDREGNFENVVLSCEGLDGYQACTSYFGAAVGRFCNRIAGSKFSLNGREYVLSANDGPNHLHGGEVGFDKRIWSTEEIVDADAVGVRMSLISEDGDQGYPGNCTVSVTYLLDNDNQLTVEFAAESDSETPVNLTNHTYWNLDGAGEGLIVDHVLQIESDQILEFNDQNLPTGRVLDVNGTRFDFSSANKIISADVEAIGDEPGVDPKEKFSGYDHNFCLRSQSGSLAAAALVYSPKSGRQLEIATTQPGVQFYTGNFLDGQPGSGGFEKHSAFCLETQHYPDSPNQPEFPSTVLGPGKPLKQTTVFKFSVVQ